MIITNKIKWQLDEAIKICQDIQPLCKLAGFHCGLIGGVLNKGNSYNDLDIIFIHLARIDTDENELLIQLRKYFDEIILISDEDYTDNDRRIYRTFNNERQIDLMVML